MKKWIWLDEINFPEHQKTHCSTFGKDVKRNYCVAQFRHTYAFSKKIKRIEMKVCADTRFRFWMNGEYIGAGPVWPGCDFGYRTPPQYRFCNKYEIETDACELNFFVEVFMGPTAMCECSWLQGGFYFDAVICFEDGSMQTVTSSPEWEVRLAEEYSNPDTVDMFKKNDEWHKAAFAPIDDEPVVAPLSPQTEEFVKCKNDIKHVINAGETYEFTAEFDKIYCGPITMDINAQSECEISVVCHEVEIESSKHQKVFTDRPFRFRSWMFCSCDRFAVTVCNKGDKPVEIGNCGVLFTHRPDSDESYFRCSNTAFDKVYDVCKWTLRLCRQSIHLDSTSHQEPLGCTGDYFIESMMTYATFGDPTLARLDIVRTADMLRNQNGIMFHTSYSLIWVQMAYEYYMYTADAGLLFEIYDALEILMSRFNGYLGENGVLEYVPNYMFVDWMTCEDHSMHHPPKAIGQAPLCAFYYKALTCAEEICRLIGKEAEAKVYSQRAADLKKAFCKAFRDEKKNIVIGGLTTPNLGGGAGYLPENIDYEVPSLHATVLAAAYDLFDRDTAREMLKNALEDTSLVQMQPYFMHYGLNAIENCGLFGEYGMKELAKWIPVVEECDKGLAEGWYKPCDNYSFDHSHAWGGTPLYQLPYRILGMKILEAGCKKVQLSPNLYGLEWAEICVPTPQGNIKCSLQQGSDPKIESPYGVEIVLA